MAASVKSRRACGPSFVFLASARSCDALKSPRNDTGIDMTNLHRSPPVNQSETDLGIVNESQLLGFGISQQLVARDHGSDLPPNAAVIASSPPTPAELPRALLNFVKRSLPSRLANHSGCGTGII